MWTGISQDMNNPLKWIHWIDNISYEKIAVMKLVLVIVEKASPTEKKLNTYILNKKHNLISKKRSSNMLIWWTKM